jgi:hypothetical protein
MDEVTFDIEAQAAAAITNIGGDQGGTDGTASWEVLELRRTLASAQEGVAGLALPPDALASVTEALSAAAKEAALPTPNRYCVAEHLRGAATILREAGALVGAGTTVVEALRRAASLLGPIGIAVVGAL